MINLIPNEEKKIMSKDFYFRLATVFFMMLGVSVLVASIILVPSYFLSSIEKRSANMKLKLQEDEPVSVPDQNVSKTIDDLKKKLVFVETAAKGKAVFSERVLNETILKKVPGIKITKIFYRNDSLKGIESIDVSGSAANREALISFRLALEDSPAFSKVDLPVSNFVKGVNIGFYLNLTPS